MSTRFFWAAFALGLAILGWVAFGFAGSNGLALAMTLAIGGVYLLGAHEQRQFRTATAGLARALAALPPPGAALSDWLEHVPPALRPAVRLRVEGERQALPGPALTPTLVGLLVMLGMLGTFLGMVVTFQGAVFALEGSTDLQAIRAALAAPIKGLGLSFGTSVAGVAASAMLGLMSAISRRERLDAARLLDQCIAGALRPHSALHRREETFKALQLQAGALPAVVERLDALMARIEQRSRALDEQLLERQAVFQREATEAYAGLARTVGSALSDSLAAGARAAGETLRPVVEHTLAQVADDARRLHDRLGTVAQAQVDTLGQQFEASARRAGESWAAAVDRQLSATAAAEQQRLADWAAALDTLAQRTGAQAQQAVQGMGRLLDASQALLHARAEGEVRWVQEHGARMDQLAGLWRSELAALRQEEAQRGQAAVERLGELQQAVAQHLASLGTALEAPMARLLQTASEVPAAAAGVLAQLHEQVGAVAQRENAALEERALLLGQLGALLQSLQQAAGEQRNAIAGLVATASSVLAGGAEQFTRALEVQGSKAAESAAHVASSAIELSSVAASFGHGVQLFQATNDKLVDSLRHIDASLNRSIARSDEQLAYYVAQAREVIDLSIASQEGLVENLRQLRIKPITVKPGAAA